jgi:polyhydroxyalkanoate synthesis repressor PhaR
VKRYSNRKLYDTVESRYVTLPQIAELVRQGQDVRIIDNNTKEDLTRMTLAQILYEEERKQSRALDLTALKDLLHSSSERFISSLRETPVGKLIVRGDNAEKPDGDAPAEDPTPPEAAPANANASAPRESTPPGDSAAPKEHKEGPGRVQQFFEDSRGTIDQWQQRADERMKAFWEGINPAAQIQALQAEVKRLQARVEHLETRLGTASGESAAPRPAGEGGEKE